MYDCIIDIGHYNCDSGAVNGSYKEVDFTKSISDKVVSILKEKNLKVATTDGSLSNRTNFENQVGAKCFVSIHVNAGGGTGFESWIYKKGGEAERLASSIEKYYKLLPIRNRGIKENPSFYVLRNTKCPAVIFECAFIDSQDLEFLRLKQNEISVAIASGICYYLNVNTSSLQNIDTVHTVSIPKNVNKLIIEFLC